MIVESSWCTSSITKTNCSCGRYHADDHEIYEKNLRAPAHMIELVLAKLKILIKRQNGEILKSAAANLSNFGVNMCGSRGTKDVQALMNTICTHLRVLPTCTLSLALRDCLVYFAQLPDLTEVPKKSNKSPKNSSKMSVPQQYKNHNNNNMSAVY